MAHFAEIQDGVVLRVLVVANEEEHRGQEFLSEDLGLGGTWVQTSYNNNFRGVFAQPGYLYDSEQDVFIPVVANVSAEPQVEPELPLEPPSGTGVFRWDRETQSWIDSGEELPPLPTDLPSSAGKN